jgi:negative regulator of sigma E activity
MKFASIVTGAILAMYAIFLLLQLWVSIVSWAVFTKVTITAAVIIVVVLGLALLYREYIEEKSMKGDNYLD